MRTTEPGRSKMLLWTMPGKGMVIAMLTFGLVMAGCGNSPKSLAKQYVELLQKAPDTGADSAESTKYQAQREQFSVKLGKLSEQDKANYDAELASLIKEALTSAVIEKEVRSNNTITELSSDGAIVKKAKKVGAALLEILGAGDVDTMEKTLATLTPDVFAALTTTNSSPTSDFSYEIYGFEGTVGIMITKYSGKGGIVVIPATIDDEPVAFIRGDAFSGDYYRHKGNGGETITAVVVPPSVDYIFGDAFRSCTNLSTVILPDSLLYLGDGVFMDCSKLHTLNFPSRLVGLSPGAFSGCENLRNFSVPDSVTSLKWDVYNHTSPVNQFKGCGKIRLPVREKLKELGYKGGF